MCLVSKHTSVSILNTFLNMFRNYTRLGIKHVKKKVTTKCLEKCLGSKHIFYSVCKDYLQNFIASIWDRLKLGCRCNVRSDRVTQESIERDTKQHLCRYVHV